ncbi:targeting protein for Xklp2 homolog isoform X2 [Gigantopelta aegis]|uniref:targeting protein for Xklp2 homolog isoform X2 n=1 Tax=Gigantopelta aegis TaxID=1735272 RepID=UPI001B889939|nr:targeting protein for Xklp2 homolog isoform X2 [Gigantopelta aegis]
MSDMWEYSCPKYVNFFEPQPLNDGADEWFDACTDDKDVNINEQVTFMKSNTAENEQPSPSELDRISQELTSSDTLPVSGDTQAASVPKFLSATAPLNTPKNLRTDISTFMKSDNKKVGTVDKQTKVTGPTRKTNNEKSCGVMSKTVSAKTVQTGEGPDKAVKRTMSMKLPHSASNPTHHTDSPNRKRPNTRGYSDEVPTKQTKPMTRSSAGCSSRPPVKMPKITVPNAPSFVTRNMASNSKKVLTTEEKELEQIASFRQQLAMKRKQAQASLKVVKLSSEYKPFPSQVKPTIPVDFSFKTDKRIKQHGQEANTQETNPSDFTKMLRSNTALDSTGPKHLTKPQPFKMSTTTRKRSSSVSEDKSSENFVSMAEKVKVFHSKTPDRFRKVPKKQEEKKFDPRLTVPCTPVLQTRNRTRGVKVPSQHQLEEEELQDMKKHQFKAHGVNTQILKHPNIGVPKVAVKPTTEPKEFNLHPGKRSVEQAETVEEKHEFHANPLPVQILKHTVGVKPAKVIPVTVPQSPAFALKNRVRLPVEIPDDKECSLTKSRPVPHVGIPFQPKISHNYTVPQPFSFEKRNKSVQQKKEEKLRQLSEDERKAKEFHAQPIPWMESPVGLPDKQVKEPTKLEPFQLKVDIRGAKKAEEWRHQVEEELNQQRSMKNFHARPAVVIKKPPFVPERSHRPLVEVDEFELNTDRRAIEREEFEEHKKAREAELEAESRQQMKRKEDEEQLAIAKLRAEMIHKANPVKKYCPVQVHLSDKPLTEPMSPRFSERLRPKVRM